MKKFYIFFILLFVCFGASSQEISIRFIGQINGTDYCRLDSVSITNITRNWTETVEYPDTIIVLGGTSDIKQNLTYTQGLGQNAPNPFNCETRVELSVPQREDVCMQLLDAMGKVNAEYCGSLDAGVHTFDISAAAQQTYILNAMAGSRSYSIRMVNMGTGCGSSIKYAGISGNITAKLTSTNEFWNGDNMRYVGYATIDGDMVTSDIVEQSLFESQSVTLHFTHSLPHVETLAASSVTNLSAILHGRITGNGGSSIVACGFYYGTSEDDLSQNVSASITGAEIIYELAGLTDGTTIYYKAYATNSLGTGYGDVRQVTIGSLNGHAFVDLGLPSGIKWATCNIGATTPEGYGDYFAWGETTPKETYTWVNYRFRRSGSASNPVFSKYTNGIFYFGYPPVDYLSTLEACDDAATANWGSGWRMPTYDELNELNSNCTVTWTTQNGVNGRLFTGPNGNSIFLPAAGGRGDSGFSSGAGSYGYYWSNSLGGSTDASEACYLYFRSDNCCMIYSLRFSGLSVRAVCPSQN